jgi:hypothetical protein
MSMRQYVLVETMLKSLPKRIARSASFLERFKAFSLAKWVAHGWKTDDPHLVLATLLDNVPSSEADSMIQQAAAQVLILACLFFLLRVSLFLARRFSEARSRRARRWRRPPRSSTRRFRRRTLRRPRRRCATQKGRVLRCLTTRRQLIDINLEFESPAKVIRRIAERDEAAFKRAVLDLAERMERSLPTLKVDVEMPQLPPEAEEEEEEVERGEDELTFTAAEIKEAFDGDWDNLVGQKTSEVQAFVLLRNSGQQQTPVAPKKGSTPPGSAKSAKSTPKTTPKSAAKSAKSSVKQQPASAAKKSMPPPLPVAPAPNSSKRKQEKKPAVAPPPAPAQQPPPSPVSEGKRHRRFWSRAEELDLVRGVRKYGKGAWKRILQDELLKFDTRSATDLKDKWRNLEKRREEYERELDALGSGDEENEEREDGRARPAAPAARKPSREGKRDAEEMEEVEDSDQERAVKKEPPAKKAQLSPTASQIRETAMEARKKRMQQQGGNAAE